MRGIFCLDLKFVLPAVHQIHALDEMKGVTYTKDLERKDKDAEWGVGKGDGRAERGPEDETELQTFNRVVVSKGGATEMIHLFLLDKHGNEFRSQHPYDIQACRNMFPTLALGKGNTDHRQMDHYKPLAGQSSQLMSYRFSRRHCLKNISCRPIKEDT